MNQCFRNYSWRIGLLLLWCIPARQILNAQTPNVILGRPTDTSVTVSVMTDQAAEGFIMYGLSTGQLTAQTALTGFPANVPVELLISALQADTAYYYRLYYRLPSAGVFSMTPVYRFHTQRAPGRSFVFTIEADEHLYDKKGVVNMYKVTLQNQLADKPDFMLSLGDIFGDDHDWQNITSPEVDELHRNYRPFLGSVCHSIPFYICLGNHEGENDYYYLQNPGNNLCVWGTKWRKHYYPNPYPNGFYSGNTDQEAYDIGHPENYYAWTWGDAQFIVLDVYRDQCDTTDKPIKWAWSLGKKQYDWLTSTLENSKSKYKFVFAHHIRGQGRGGITNATQFEWGGLDNGKDKFAQYRPGWAKPIHQLFVDHKVDIFFQGHDHVFSHEVLDGVTYQSCPMPSDSTYRIGMHDNGDAYTADTFDGSGHVRVTVGAEGVKVDFVRAYLPKDTLGIHKNREVPFSYTVRGNPARRGNPGLIQPLLAPNPASEVIRLEQPLALRQLRMDLLSLTGKLLAAAEGRHLQVSHIPDGCYIMRIQADEHVFYQKVIIQK